MNTRVLVIAGSTREASFSKQLARAACAQLAAAGAQASFIDLRDFPMPLYDGDLEAATGLPPEAVRLRAQMLAHDALVVVTPEYNSSLPAVLKNALDWLSRPHAPEPGVSPYKGKVAALLSSSPGALGGLRALVHLRQVLQNVGCLVITEQFALGNAGKAFADDGKLADAKQAEGVAGVLNRLVEVSARLAG